MTELGIAAIWCRVSTHDQRELSPDSQEAAVRSALRARGFEAHADYVLKVDWTSLDLMACPEFQQLRRWITSGVIQAVGVFDRDRLQAQGLQRLLFLAECREHGVTVVTAQGPTMLGGSEGEFLELALAFGKEQAVRRAQEGARNGLRDRALLRHLPPSPKNFLGYRWNGSNYVPDESYPIAQRIWQMLLAGEPDRGIAAALTREGIPTPRRQQSWSSRTIALVANNPAYYGRYTALRVEAVTPLVRTGTTYGKSSARWRAPEQQVPLDGLVLEPIVTPEQFAWVQARRQENKAFGGRHIHRYLLRGMIECGRCGRRYSGKARLSGRVPYAYRCGGTVLDVGRETCGAPQLQGPALEAAVWDAERGFLEHPEHILREAARESDTTGPTEDTLQRSITRLEQQLARNAGYRQRAYDGYARGMTDEATLLKVMEDYQREEAWLTTELGRQQQDLLRIKERALATSSVEALRERLQEHLAGATPEEQRFVLECLGTRVLVDPQQIIVEISVPEDVLVTVGSIPP